MSPVLNSSIPNPTATTADYRRWLWLVFIGVCLLSCNGVSLPGALPSPPPSITPTPMSTPTPKAAPSAAVPLPTLTPNPQAEFVRYDARSAWRAFLGWPDDCEEGFERFEHEPEDAGGIEIYPAADGQYLAFVTCNLGPYWVEQRAYWLDYRINPPVAHPLSVPELLQDDKPERGLQDVDTLTGAFPTYHPETQTLTNLHAYRGLKDCGVFYKYHIEAGRFVLDEARYRDCVDTEDPPLLYEEWMLVYPLAAGSLPAKVSAMR